MAGLAVLVSSISGLGVDSYPRSNVSPFHNDLEMGLLMFLRLVTRVKLFHFLRMISEEKYAELPAKQRKK
jgi:hypothetical protein